MHGCVGNDNVYRLCVCGEDKYIPVEFNTQNTNTIELIRIRTKKWSVDKYCINAWPAHETYVIMVRHRDKKWPSFPRQRTCKTQQKYQNFRFSAQKSFQDRQVYAFVSLKMNKLCLRARTRMSVWETMRIRENRKWLLLVLVWCVVPHHTSPACIIFIRTAQRVFYYSLLNFLLWKIRAGNFSSEAVLSHSDTETWLHYCLVNSEMVIILHVMIVRCVCRYSYSTSWRVLFMKKCDVICIHLQLHIIKQALYFYLHYSWCVQTLTFSLACAKVFAPYWFNRTYQCCIIKSVQKYKFRFLARVCRVLYGNEP